MSIAMFIYDPAGPGVPILCHFKKFKVRSSASSRPGRLQCLVCNIHHELDHFTVGERERETLRRAAVQCCQLTLGCGWHSFQVARSWKLLHSHIRIIYFCISPLLSCYHRSGDLALKQRHHAFLCPHLPQLHARSSRGGGWPTSAL